LIKIIEILFRFYCDLFTLFIIYVFYQAVQSRLGLSIKYVRSRGREGGRCPVQTKEVIQIRTSELFGTKRIKFFEICSVSARTRGGGLSRADKGVLQMWTSARFSLKLIKILKFMVCPHGQEEREG